MLLVDAKAGTGKTTTGGWGLGKRVPKGVKASEEQKAVIKEMRKLNGKKQGAQAFNTAIVRELPDKMPPGVDIATSNAFGHRAWAREMDANLVVDGLKTRKIFRKLCGQRYQFKERLRIENAVNALVGFCKCYLFDPTEKEVIYHLSSRNGGGAGDGNAALMWLADRFDVDYDDCIREWVEKVFIESVKPSVFIDFNDQNFLPIYHDIDLRIFDHLLVDEVQDLNLAKQEMAFRLAERVTAIGDVNQAIYGFSGADADAMDTMAERMGGKVLPLTYTRRCPKRVVSLANQYVPELKATDDAPDGEILDISEKDFTKSVLDGGSKMILCRLNAPLTSLAFKLLARNKRCYIQGRDIGSGIKTELKRSGSNDLSGAVATVHNRTEQKIMEISQRDFPDTDQIDALRDRMICIDILAGGADSLDGMFAQIDRLFKDSGNKDDTVLSSIHKAKGLEHPDVCIYKPSKVPYIKLMKGYQAQQEKNLAYVAYTRSMDKLTFVREESDE